MVQSRSPLNSARTRRGVEGTRNPGREGTPDSTVGSERIYKDLESNKGVTEGLDLAAIAFAAANGVPIDEILDKHLPEESEDTAGTDR